MKIDLVYRNTQTNRVRTLKHVNFMGVAHVRAIEEAIPGDYISYPIYREDVPEPSYVKGKLVNGINYGIPHGFRIVLPKSGRAKFAKADRRIKHDPGNVKALKDLETQKSIIKKVGIAGRQYHTTRKNKGVVLNELLDKRYFTAPASIYTIVPKDRNNRKAHIVEYPLHPHENKKTIEYQQGANDAPIALPMRYFNDFADKAEDEQFFDGRPAYVFIIMPGEGLIPYEEEDIKFYQSIAVSEWNITILLVLKGKLESAEVASTIQTITVSAECLMVVYKDEIRRNQKIATLQPSFYDSAYDIPAGRDQPLLNSPLIEYHIQPSMTFKDMFDLRTSPDNACMLTFIWDNLQEDKKFQIRNKKLYAEIEADPYLWMWSICFPDKPYTGVFDMITTRQALPLFDALGKELKIFDASSQLWAYYKPPVSKDSYCKVMSMIVHNNHVYPCNRPRKIAHYIESNRYNIEDGTVQDKWTEKKDEFAKANAFASGEVEKKEEEKKLTVSFPLPRIPKPTDGEEETVAPVRMNDELCAELRKAPPMYITGDETAVHDKVAEIISHPYNYGDFTHYQFYTPEPVQVVYNNVFTESGYECGISSNNQKVWSGLNASNLVRDGEKLHVSIRPIPLLLRNTMEAYEDPAEAEKLLQEYFVKDKEVKNAILSPNILSQYSKHTLDFYRHYKRGGRSGQFIDQDFFDRMDKTRRLLGLDFAKFYTSILCSFEKIQVLTMFDDPLPYDGHKIEDYTTYEVINKGNTYTYQKCSLCLGLNLKRQFVDPHEIIRYVRPSRLAENHIPAIMRELWESDLNGELKKVISNSMSGTLGMDHGSSFYSRAFFDEREASHYMGFMKKSNTEYIRYDFGMYGNHIQTGRERAFDVITLIQNDRSYYHSGFLPVYHMLIDTADQIMYNLQNDIESEGLRLIGRHTDNIYVDVDYDNKEAVLDACNGWLRHIMCPFEKDQSEHLGISFISDKYDSFGKLKPEPKMLGKKLYPLNIVERELFSHPQILDSRKVLTCNEWDEAEMFKIIDDNPFLFISAVDAGSGKTYLGTKYIKQWEDLKVLVLSFQNDKVAELRKDFEDYEFSENVTISTIDSFFPYTKEGIAMAYNKLKDYDLVMVDEFDITPIPSLTKLMRAVDLGLISRMIITSDCHQLDAINHYINNIPSQEEYYDRIKTKWFPVELRLQEIKRVRCPNHQVVYDLPTIRDCAECKEVRRTVSNIYRSIREAPDDETAQKIVLDTFQHVTNIKDVGNENIITFFCETRSILNDFCHRRILQEKGLKPDTKYYEGQKLVCCKRHDFKDGIIHRNYNVTFRREDGDKAVIHEPSEDTEYKPSMSSLDTHYRRSHAVTCYSKQGATIYGNTYLFDVTAKRSNKKWLYVAVSRNSNIWNNYIYAGPNLWAMNSKHVKTQIERMISSHRKADDKAGRPFTEEQYITPEYILDLLMRTRTCAWCEGDVTQKSFSIDRIDSELAHTMGNCQLLCSSACNSAKRKNFEAVL